MTSQVGMPFSVRTAATNLGGSLHPFCDGQETISTVTIDSRDTAAGSLFVPLSGRFVDGHEYIPQALKRGAVLSLVNEDKAEQVFRAVPRELQFRLLIVDDSLRALQRLARWYIERNEKLIRIAISGSSGKTTTKEVLAAILGREYSVFKTPGNFNSVIGVPLSAFRITQDHQYAVFELAMSEVGEMAQLAAVVFPDLAVLTNIGTAHIGNIGSKDGIAKEKKAIFSGFSGRQRAFLCEEEPYYDFLAAGVDGQVIPFGIHHTPGFRSSRSNGLDGTVIEWDGREIGYSLPGVHNLQNALAAISAAVEIGVSPESVQQGLEAVESPLGRGQILHGEITMIQDSYNANPESMAASVEFCAGVPWRGRKTVVLGDMLELGDASARAHENMIDYVRSFGFDRIWWVGEGFSGAIAQKGIKPGECVGRFPGEVVDDVLRYLHPNDLLLLKGSRGLQLEKIGAAVQHVSRKGGARC